MFVIRDIRPTDIPFIVSSWSQSYYGAPAVRGMERDDFFPWMKKLILGRLSGRNCQWALACTESDPDVILGWACFEGDLLHYVFIRGGKDGFRGLGIAKMLVGDRKITAYTHKTERARKIPDGWKFRPDLA